MFTSSAVRSRPLRTIGTGASYNSRPLATVSPLLALSLNRNSPRPSLKTSDLPMPVVGSLRAAHTPTVRHTLTARRASRKRTADRDAFQRYVCHTLKRMSCQTPVIVGDRKPAAGKGTPSRRQVIYVPYDPSFEMPDEGGADSMSRCNT